MIQLAIERIGDGNPAVPNRAWVRWIRYLHPIDGFVYDTLKPQLDYSRANSIGTRGVYAYYILTENALYEISAPLSWKRVDHYYCRIANDEIIRMTRDEVFKCLKTGLVSTS